jgi:hypothetical protein
MSKYINHLDISANCYADNIERAIELIEKSINYKSDYEKQVETFYNKGVKLHRKNYLKCREANLKLHHKKVIYKANVKIRKIIQKSEKELFSLQKYRRSQILESVCTEFQVNIKTIRRILL